MAYEANAKPEVIEHSKHGGVDIGARPILSPTAAVDSVAYKKDNATLYLLTKCSLLPLPLFPSSSWNLLMYFPSSIKLKTGGDRAWPILID